MNRPNVLFLSTDQQRRDALGAVNGLVKTPNLDALAASGALFDHSFATTPVCMPSRMSTLSGRYHGALGIRSNGAEMPEDIPCLQHILSAYGYHTANIGKLHFRNHASAFRDHRRPHPRYGFDTLILSDEPGCYDDAYLAWVAARDPDAVDLCRADTPPAWTGTPVRRHPRRVQEPYPFAGPEHLTHSAFVADETCSFLERTTEPFFCIAGFYAPHPPVNPPQRFVDWYDEAAMPLPTRNPGEEVDGVDDAGWRRARAYYLALVSHVDEEVGHILATLDERGLRDRTLIVFTSDHGEHLGDHGRTGKGSPEDSSSRVPLILAGGRPQPVGRRQPQGQASGGRRSSSTDSRSIPAGKRIPEITESVDLAPTILDWCGVQQPPEMAGRSLTPLLTGMGYEPRSSAYLELQHDRRAGYKAVRTYDHLYVRHGGGDEELFDLNRDPAQLTNLAGDPEMREVLAELRGELVHRTFDVDAFRPRTGQY